MKSLSKKCSAAAIGAAVLMSATGAHAGVTNATATGYGASANLSLLFLNLGVAPTAFSSGTAPAPFMGMNSAITLNANVAGLATINTGVLNGTSASDVDGLNGFRYAGATGTIDGLNAGVVLGTILNLSATTIGSSAQVSGNYGSLATNGNSVLEDLNLSVLGNPLSVDANASPNTVLFDALGIRIVINEQFETGNGIDAAGIEVNAVHISFTNAAAGLGLLNGDIRFGHSFAELNAVIPTPASAGVFAAFGVCSSRRRRR